MCWTLLTSRVESQLVIVLEKPTSSDFTVYQHLQLEAGTRTRTQTDYFNILFDTGKGLSGKEFSTLSEVLFSLCCSWQFTS